MATVPYLLTLPTLESMPARTLRNGVAAMAINAETSADAKAMAKAYQNGEVNATWAQSTATQVAAATDMTGWALRIKVVAPPDNDGVSEVIFDDTIEDTDVAGSLVKATGTLTTSTQPSDTNTITIGSNVYTLQSSLTNVAGHVKIAASEVLTLVNLKNAINGTGGTPGTDYAAATVAHPTVEATASATHTVSIRALTAGSAGNAIATTDTLTAGGDGFAAVTLTGGVGLSAAISGFAAAMVTSLNAIAAIAGAAYNESTHVLTVASAGDAIGDSQVYVWWIPKNADRSEVKGITNMVVATVDGGVSGAALTTTFRADTYTVATLVALLGAE